MPNTSYITRRDATLRLDGDPFQIDGFNTYYLMVYAADPELRDHVDEVLDKAVDRGLNTLRTWAFNDGADEWNALQPAAGEWSEEVFRGLDYVIREAGRRGIRLILPLVNYWPDYGGMDQYVAWSGTAERRDDFYTDSGCRAMFRDHIAAVVGRTNRLTGRAYRDDPTILAWELANEPRCPSDRHGWRLYRWIDATSRYIKSLDDNHLVATGMEGFHGPWTDRFNPPRWLDGEGTDFAWHHEPEAVDLACFHLYPDHWWMHEADGVRWIREHVRVARRELGKPVILEEFGKRGSPALRRRCFDAWADEVAQWSRPNQPLAGSLFWALYHDDYPDYDGFGIY